MSTAIIRSYGNAKLVSPLVLFDKSRLIAAPVILVHNLSHSSLTPGGLGSIFITPRTGWPSNIGHAWATVGLFFYPGHNTGWRNITYLLLTYSMTKQSNELTSRLMKPRGSMPRSQGHSHNLYPEQSQSNSLHLHSYRYINTDRCDLSASVVSG